ncbi:hypothetical protein [Sorangium sp. So ce1389]|uniref:hypothetical protein n=1 Tax=Sorangium sp. So ce1389 TaxID=3133336 RepID=UPI003F62AE0D
MRALPGPELAASRTYFAEFDRTLYSQVGWTADEVDGLRAGLERKLKLLGLVKGHVLVPASHLLESELAREIVFDCPELLSKGVIVPALRQDFASCEEFLESKRADPDRHEAVLYEEPKVREMAQLIDMTARIEPWHVGNASAWFRDRLLADLDDDKSLLQTTIRRRGFALPADFRTRVADIERVSRGAVYRVAREVTANAKGTELWELLCSYADFLYYLGGARAVRSEGVLPQENLLDFSVRELTSGGTRLSEFEVFFKIFVDVVKAATSTHFPLDLLDALSLGDVVELHEIPVSREFVEKYNLIQAKTKEGLELHDPERLVLLMEELDEFELELHRNMEASIRREMPGRLKQQRKENAASFLHSLASLLVPYYDAPGDARDIVVSALRVAGWRSVADSIERRIRDGVDALNALSLDHSPATKPILLTFVERLKREYIEKLRAAE